MHDFRKLVQGVASIAAGVKCGFCSIIWIGALKSTFNHIYSDMLMSAKDDKYFITVTHNPINLTTCINQPLKTRNVSWAIKPCKYYHSDTCELYKCMHKCLLEWLWYSSQIIETKEPKVFTCPGITSLGTEWIFSVQESLDFTHQPWNTHSCPSMQSTFRMSLSLNNIYVKRCY